MLRKSLKALYRILILNESHQLTDAGITIKDWQITLPQIEPTMILFHECLNLLLGRRILVDNRIHFFRNCETRYPIFIRIVSLITHPLLISLFWFFLPKNDHTHFQPERVHFSFQKNSTFHSPKTNAFISFKKKLVSLV
ncbi:hypothetical protein DFO70_1324 [Cytobacillus firmus]|uniref:Uncharacterized protein n=2 Tax=Cytobacillus TaxID=2675230 RepID=A0A366JI06_CYTFI|nr:hypothetical protein DFO70_1324 [Cytobacillus firmus]TDX35453.1 hypothetical protein DFO72_12811 [Cytobacillus oceanisediminis]